MKRRDRSAKDRDWPDDILDLAAEAVTQTLRHLIRLREKKYGEEKKGAEKMVEKKGRGRYDNTIDRRINYAKPSVLVYSMGRRRPFNWGSEFAFSYHWCINCNVKVDNFVGYTKGKYSQIRLMDHRIMVQFGYWFRL